MGYCKFKEECHFQHFHETCQKRLCKDNECRFRHPKTCKFRQNCKFFQKKICFFKHHELQTVKIVNSQKEIDILEKEVAKLKDEILHLKNNVNKKEHELEARAADVSEQERLAKSFFEENNYLKISIIKLEDELVNVKSDNESLTVQTESLKNALKSQESKNNMLKKEIEEKHATNKARLNDLDHTIHSPHPQKYQ